MLLTNLLTTALLAFSVSAAPSPDEAGAALQARDEINARNSNKCPYYGQIYNSHFKTCKCPPGKEIWKNKCDYKPYPEPYCPDKDNWGNKNYKYCSKGKNDYVMYHESHSYCKNNGKNAKPWCSPHKDAKDKCKDKYKNEKDCENYYGDKLKRNSDDDDERGYNSDENKCKCAYGYEYDKDKKKCRYPIVQKPNCKDNKLPWCGKGKKKYCKYNKYEDYCEDDGSAWGFCSYEKDVKDYCDKEFDD